MSNHNCSRKYTNLHNKRPQTEVIQIRNCMIGVGEGLKGKKNMEVRLTKRHDESLSSQRVVQQNKDGSRRVVGERHPTLHGTTTKMGNGAVKSN